MEIKDRLADIEAAQNFTLCIAIGLVQALKASGIDAKPFIAARLNSLEATMNAEALSERRLAAFQELAQGFLGD